MAYTKLLFCFEVLVRVEVGPSGRLAWFAAPVIRSFDPDETAGKKTHEVGGDTMRGALHRLWSHLQAPVPLSEVLLSYNQMECEQQIIDHGVGKFQFSPEDIDPLRECHDCRGFGTEVLFQVPRDCKTCRGQGVMWFREVNGVEVVAAIGERFD